MMIYSNDDPFYYTYSINPNRSIHIDQNIKCKHAIKKSYNGPASI